MFSTSVFDFGVDFRSFGLQQPPFPQPFRQWMTHWTMWLPTSDHTRRVERLIRIAAETARQWSLMNLRTSNFESIAVQ